MLAVERNWFQYKVFVGLVWLTSNHIFGSGNFRDKPPSWFLKNLKLPSFYSDNVKIFKKNFFVPLILSEENFLTFVSYLNALCIE